MNHFAVEHLFLDPCAQTQHIGNIGHTTVEFEQTRTYITIQQSFVSKFEIHDCADHKKLIALHSDSAIKPQSTKSNGQVFTQIESVELAQ